jgi:hypothetical protein
MTHKSCREIEKQIAAVKRIIKRNDVMKESDKNVKVSLDYSEENKDIGRKKA